ESHVREAAQQLEAHPIAAAARDCDARGLAGLDRHRRASQRAIPGIAAEALRVDTRVRALGEQGDTEAPVWLVQLQFQVLADRAPGAGVPGSIRVAVHR